MSSPKITYLHKRIQMTKANEEEIQPFFVATRVYMHALPGAK